MVRKSRPNMNSSAVLQIRDLHVYYDQSHALQGVNLTLEKGVHAVIGRNGMGKSTLCNTIMGLLKPRSGSIRFMGEEITGLAPHRIAGMGIGYTPQGRRLWPSLTVDEHLALCDKGSGAWTIDRIYETFPRLYERRGNGGSQLSGGEQQMLAISRALLQDPQLLVLDEPTEGLAPVVVDQVVALLTELAASGNVSVLLIEQNISVATTISEDVAIMVNGRIDRIMPSKQLAGDRALQERLLGVGRHSHDEIDNLAHDEIDLSEVTATATEEEMDQGAAELAAKQASESQAEQADVKDKPKKPMVYIPPTRWSRSAWKESEDAMAAPTGKIELPFDTVPEPLHKETLTPIEPHFNNEVLVVGTFDTKGAELSYIRDCIRDFGVRVKTVDLSTSGALSSADVPPHMIATYHPGGANAVFSNDRGAAVGAMSEAFANWISHQRGISGIISAGGSGGTMLATPAMQALPIGVPKVMISTLASGDVGEYVGPSDIMMMYSVTDVQGLNRISRQILANGAHAIAGMSQKAQAVREASKAANMKPGLGLTMFGVTTTAVQQITAQLEDNYDCLVFHATGVGGRSMEKLADNGMLAAAIDLTTTEVCDMIAGGAFPATEDRFGAFIRNPIPYIGSVGALDMVNFRARNTVPEKYNHRVFIEHNSQVTLMRTTTEENTRMGEWIANRINKMTGPVRFLIPEGGVSALDAPGQPFFDPDANSALFDALFRTFKETSSRRLISTPHHINDPAFADVVVEALEEINPTQRSARSAAY